MLKVANVGEVRLLQMALGENSQENLQLRLFVNNITPADTDTDATFTQMSQHSYASATITMAQWTVTTNGSGEAEAVAPAKTFSFTDDTVSGTVPVYGYYVVGATSGVLLWAEKFASPINISTTGQSIEITPKITLSTN